MRRRGYTLIEMMIVIVLLGLAGALLVPHLVGGDSLKVQAAVRQVIGDLSFAQSDALAQQERRRVHFYADGRGFCLFRVDQNDYATAFDDLDPNDIDYVHDPLKGGQGNYIVDFSVDRRFRGVFIADVNIDGDGAGAAGDIVYDRMGGTIHSGGAPGGGTGGRIVIAAGDNVYNIDIAPFTGKMTVSEEPP